MRTPVEPMREVVPGRLVAEPGTNGGGGVCGLTLCEGAVGDKNNNKNI